MRIGIFGGSFDPIHYGHLILAERCREEAELDQIWFMPSSTTPHKRHGSTLTDRQRVELIELALAGNKTLVVSDIELKRGGISYTVDTLTEIRKKQPDDELFLIIGADSLHQFKSWREPGRICELAIPLVINRPAAGSVDLDLLARYVDAERLKLIKQSALPSPMIEISSSDIRCRVAQNRSIRYLTPRAVEKYIETNKLYLANETVTG